jgi:hypothetical protein
MNARSSVHGSFRHSEDVARAKARPCLPNVEGLDLVYFVTWAEGLPSGSHVMEWKLLAPKQCELEKQPASHRRPSYNNLAIINISSNRSGHQSCQDNAGKPSRPTLFTKMTITERAEGTRPGLQTPRPQARMSVRCLAGASLARASQELELRDLWMS